MKVLQVKFWLYLIVLNSNSILSKINVLILAVYPIYDIYLGSLYFYFCFFGDWSGTIWLSKQAYEYNLIMFIEPVC